MANKTGVSKSASTPTKRANTTSRAGSNTPSKSGRGTGSSKLAALEENLLERDDDEMSMASTSSSRRSRVSKALPPAPTSTLKDAIFLQPVDPSEDNNSPNNTSMSSNNSSTSSIYTRYQCRATNGRDCPIKDCLIHHRKKKTRRPKVTGDEAQQEGGGEYEEEEEYSSNDESVEDEEEEEEDVKPEPVKKFNNKPITSGFGIQSLARSFTKTSANSWNRVVEVSARATTSRKTNARTATVYTSNGTKLPAVRGRGRRVDVFSSDEDDEADDGSENGVDDQTGYQKIVYHVTEFITLRRFSKHPVYEKISEVIDEVTPEPVKAATKSVHSWISKNVPKSILWAIFLLLAFFIFSQIGLLPTFGQVVNNIAAGGSRAWNIITCLVSSITSVFPVITLPSFNFWSSSFHDSISPAVPASSPPPSWSEESLKTCQTCSSADPDAALQARLRDLETRLADLLSKQEEAAVAAAAAALNVPPPIPESSDSVESLVKEAVEKSSHQARQEILSWLESRPELLAAKTSGDGSSGVSLADVERMIRLYDADKTGVTDYAFEPAGGTVISTHCSDTYDIDHQSFKLLGMPLFSSSNSPRKVIQAGTNPGDCWALKGTAGFVTIKLARKIIPTSFTMEHAHKNLLPDGVIDSAPRQFRVYGLHEPDGEDRDLLGEFEYQDLEDQPLQTFRVDSSQSTAYLFIRLHVLSNHGNLDYTCLYRFRVHGKLPSSHP